MAATGRQPACLAADGLVHRYGERFALGAADGGVSFTVPRGAIFGFLGPNGAGKSTLFHILSGLLAPSAGTLSFHGRPIRPTDREYRARLGVVFQQPSLDLKLTGRENLALGASLYAVPTALARRRITEALALVELGERAGERVERYSGGMRRRLELARVLLHEPELLVMDEPTQGLDLASSRRLCRHLLALRDERRLTILVTTHDPAEAEHADQLLVLDQGRVIASGAPAELTRAVGGDVLTIEGDEPEAIAQEISRALSLPVRVLAGRVVLERERGHELVPRIVELFPAGRLRAVGMRPPTLGDAFVKLTGRELGSGADADARDDARREDAA